MANVFSCLLLLILLISSCQSSPGQLKSYNVDKSKISVSGISSGAYFAVQFHIAYSSIIMGAGAIAGGPYHCANGNLNMALTLCMNNMIPGSIDNSLLVDTVHLYARISKVDNPSYLTDDRVYIYSGTKDTVVRTAVVKALEKFYNNFVNKSNIQSVYDIPSQHSIVTTDYGNTCSTLGSPFINNCHYSNAYNVLKQIYGSDIKQGNASTIVESNLIEFSQSEFFPDTHMDNVGYIYVPSGCQKNGTVCRLHIAFHGCKQGREYIDTQFVLHAGYSEVAEVNNIIVVYPQIHKSVLSNPNGCWDWWGYTTSDYANQSGPQMAGVRKILNRIIGKTNLTNNYRENM